MKFKYNKLEFIGIGAQKSASTWLSRCLGEHPNIFIPKQKELDFWNKVAHCPTTLNKINIPFEKYLSFFDEAEQNQIKGEFSTHYIFDSKAPELIKKHFPDIKIIAIVRDPIKRAISQYYHIKKLIKFNYTFEESLSIYPEIKERGLYFKQLSRYYKQFPSSNIKIVILEDFQNNSLEIIHNIYSFLGVNKNFNPESIYKNINIKKIVKNKKIRNLKNYIKKNNAGKKIILYFSSIGLDRYLEKIYLKNSVSNYIINEKTKKELTNYFLEDKKNLEKLINKKINNWSF